MIARSSSALAIFAGIACLGGARFQPPGAAPVVKLTPTGKTSDAVVLVIVDALRPDHLGAYGYDRPVSPNLDRLAGEGVLFTEFFSASSWTRPSTASLLTGLPYAVHGCDAYRTLDQEITTVGERFKAAGYRTAAFMANPVVSGKFGFGQGFDEMLDLQGQKSAAWSAAPDADELVDRAISWIEEVKDDKFFLVVFAIDAHDPWRAPRRWRKRFEPAQVPRRNVARELTKPLPKAELEGLLGAYDAEIAFADHELGRLFDHLRGSERWDRTTVAVTADHADAFGEHGAYRHAFHMWDEVLRVPLILRSPAFSERAGRVDGLFQHHDLALTLFDAAGLGVPDDLARHGVSILQAMQDPAAYDAQNRILAQGVGVHGIRRAVVRSRTGKLVVHFPTHEATFKRKFGSRGKVPSAVFGKQKRLFFDISSDPFERSPLSPDDHAEGRRLSEDLARRARLLALMTEPGVGPRRIGKQLRRRLESLGY